MTKENELLSSQVKTQKSDSVKINSEGRNICEKNAQLKDELEASCRRLEDYAFQLQRVKECLECCNEQMLEAENVHKEEINALKQSLGNQNQKIENLLEKNGCLDIKTKYLEKI